MTIASNAKLRLSNTQIQDEAPPLNWLDYFGLNESPFQASARLSMFYNQPRLQKIVESCLTFEQQQPLCIVTGMIGSGKSTLMRQLLAQIDRQAMVCAVKGGVTYSVNELLEAMTEDFCLPISSGRTIQSRLNQYLASMDLGRQYYLVIDDAHDLPLDTLAALMHFCVAKSADTDFIVCLMGEQSLNSRIDSLMNKRGKISDTRSFTLEPMSLDETEQYLKFRCMKAGLEKTFPLSVSDVSRIHRLSGGVPGRVNRVAQQVMIDIMRREIQSYDRQTDNAVWQANPLDDDSMGLRWFAVSLFVALACCTVWLFYGVNTVQDFELATSKPMDSKHYLAYASSQKAVEPSAIGHASSPKSTVAFVSDHNSRSSVHPWSLEGALKKVNNAVIHSLQPEEKLQANTDDSIEQKLSQKQAMNFATALQDGKGYAVQLLALHHQAELPSDLEQSQLASEVHEVSVQVNGETWNLILLGHFSTRKEASDLIKSLPESLQAYKPWVRSLASVKKHVLP